METPWEVIFYGRMGPVGVVEDPYAERAVRVRNKAERAARFHLRKLIFLKINAILARSSAQRESLKWLPVPGV